jgi:hypothetical protein
MRRTMAHGMVLACALILVGGCKSLAQCEAYSDLLYSSGMIGDGCR